NTFGNPYPIALEGTTCYGDSGGPLYIQGGVVGVLSSGYNNYADPCLYGDISQWVSIANPLNLEFLASQGINVSYVPEPPTLLMFLPGLLALRLCRNAVRRNRRAQ
ncbi:MAG: trypsin-like serine protease, partial [Candidatus Methylumidiphilus sp.]